MRLYEKQLNSLAELKLEEMRLRESIKGGVTDFKETAANPGSGQDRRPPDYVSIIIDILSNDLISGALLKMGLPVIKKAGKFAGNNLFAVGKELFGGYLKWKALELGYRWARRYLNKKQNDKR